MSATAHASGPVELTIRSLGARGDGVADYAGQPVFVPFTLPGDTVLASLGARRSDGIAAELVRMEKPGPGRIPPVCRHFGDCGSCAVQHLDDATYATWKRNLLVDALTRIGVDGSLIAPLVRIAPGTRRRAAFGFTRVGKGAVLGYARRATHHLINVEECPVLTPALFALLAPLRAALVQSLPSGVIGDAVATCTETGIDLVIESEAKLNLKAREALAAFAEALDLARISWRKPKGPAELVVQRRPPIARPGGVSIELPPGAFLQPSAEGEAALVRLVTEAVDEYTAKGDRVADLYAGCGSFTLPLVRHHHRRIHAVEGEGESLAALAHAAARASLPVTTETRDLARRPLRGRDLAGFAAVIFDPPRVGAASQAAALAESGPKLVVAVSCNPATLGRDARILIDGGYRLIRATPVDQFLWSAHLEAVAVFVK